MKFSSNSTDEILNFSNQTPKKIKEMLFKDIICIQKWIKMHLAKKKYKFAKKSIVLIQTMIKMHSVRGLYQKILSAIKFIQIYWRRAYKKS